MVIVNDGMDGKGVSVGVGPLKRRLISSEDNGDAGGGTEDEEDWRVNDLVWLLVRRGLSIQLGSSEIPQSQNKT